MNRSILVYPVRAIALTLIVALSTGSIGCASATTKGARRAQSWNNPKPNGIVIFDFEPTAESIGLDGGRDTHENGRRLTNEDLKNRREVGRVLADVLASELDDRGIVTSRKSGRVDFADGLMAIGGQIVTVEEGSRAKRVFIGFGSGKSKLTTVAQLYGSSPTGPNELWEYQNTAASGSKPGILTTLPIGAAVQGFTLALLVVNGGLATIGELSSVSSANAKRMADELADAVEETLERITR